MVKYFNSSIWPIDRTLLCTTTLGQIRLASNGNEGVLHISKKSSALISSSDDLISYPGYLLRWGGRFTPLQKRSRRILQLNTTGLFIFIDNPLKFMDQLIYVDSNISSTESDVNIYIVAERNLNFCLARNLIWPLE